MEQSNFVKGLKENWFILVFVGGIIIQWAENRKDTGELKKDVVALTETVKTLTKVIEEKVAKEAARLDEEDNGVRGDSETADAELAKDIIDLGKYENMRERASTAEMKVWFYENKE